MENYILIFVGMVTCLVSFASAKPGIATFYTKYIRLLVAFACFKNQDHGKMIVVASDALWKNRAVCGKKFTMKCTEHRNGVPHPCTGKSVTVKVIDQCPGYPSTMDLSREAFKIIAKPVAGIINIDYKKYA